MPRNLGSLSDQEFSEALGSAFKMITAFSRDGPEKVYVQHRLREHAQQVNDLVENHKAYFYVCGDAANMAREVNSTLVQIIADQRNLSEAKAEEIVKRMRSSNQYQVWLFLPLPLLTPRPHADENRL